jgi:hypothetical protein
MERKQPGGHSPSETTEGLVGTSPYVLHLAAHIARLGIARTEVEYYSYPIADRSLPHSIG